MESTGSERTQPLDVVVAINHLYVPLLLVVD